MKKIFITALSSIIFLMAANAESFPPLKYKNIEVKDKVFYAQSNDTWFLNGSKKNDYYFIKTKGFGDFFDYLYPNKGFAFSTECEYEFLYNGRFIGYSNRDLKFFDITFINGGLSKRALSKEEVENMLPEYKVIAISEFSKNTNALKIKKHLAKLKVLIYNDTERTFDDYSFSSGNSDFDKYLLRGFINISKPGMIQFAREGGNTDSSPWFMLLVR